jgi:hypothetical protein
MDEGPARRRAVSLLPAGVVLLGWVVVYRLAGLGSRGSGL